MSATLASAAEGLPGALRDRLLRLDPAAPEGERLSGDARATVVAWPAAGGAPALAVKVYRRSPWLLWTHPPGASSPAAREFAALRALGARGVPAVEPLAAVEWRAAGFVAASAVATRRLEGWRALDEALSRDAARWDARAFRRFRRHAAEAAGALVGTLHERGLLHGSLAVKNLLCGPVRPGARPEFRLVDVPRLRIYEGDLRGEPALPDLRGLDSRSWCFFSRADRLRFVRAYLGRDAGRAGRRRLVEAFYASLGGPAAARRYERAPGRRPYHRALRRLLPPRKVHRLRAAWAVATGRPSAPRAPLLLRLDLSRASREARLGQDPLPKFLRDLFESLGPHAAEVRIAGAPPDWTAALAADARSAGIPVAGPEGGAGPPLRERPPVCDRPWREATVAGDGSVRPCPGAPEAYGSLLETPLRDLWNGPRWAAARRTLLAEKPDPSVLCGRCRAAGFPYARPAGGAS
ncbi:MAG: SPASM domain-containing protein [Planctomycetales bacterium]|nr:SPASM domain-containing protein [Planctomycetales bacterium]